MTENSEQHAVIDDGKYLIPPSDYVIFPPIRVAFLVPDAEDFDAALSQTLAECKTVIIQGRKDGTTHGENDETILFSAGSQPIWVTRKAPSGFRIRRIVGLSGLAGGSYDE